MKFTVIDLKTGRSHGDYDTLDEALGCVAYDDLRLWEIWHNDTLVAYRELGTAPRIARG